MKGAGRRERERGEPGRREDARNLTLVVGAGLVGVLITGALAAGFDSGPRRAVRTEVIRVRPSRIVTPLHIPDRWAGGDGSGLIWGRVVTRSGARHTGFIRWDRNEGSWADLLDATKDGRKSGIRFGEVRSIEPLGRRSARVTLKSGQEVELGADLTDLGPNLRGMVITDPERGSVELGWRDLRRVDFEPAPPGRRAPDQRLFGTLVTRSGLSFTGFVTWDIDEIFTSDILDGTEGGRDRKIPFGAVETIEKRDSRSAWVTLTGGQRMLLAGGEDVSRANDGITVSDPALGEVKLPWGEFASVRFRRPPPGPSYRMFHGGEPIRGTVLTTSGRALAGTVVWDRDEASGWEMLDGRSGGVEFQIAFAQITRITKDRDGRGATVELWDGRTFDLEGSNDVDAGNQGILVGTAGHMDRVPWREFSELRIGGSGG